MDYRSLIPACGGCARRRAILAGGLEALINPNKVINLHGTRSSTERKLTADLIGGAGDFNLAGLARLRLRDSFGPSSSLVLNLDRTDSADLGDATALRFTWADLTTETVNFSGAPFFTSGSGNLAGPPCTSLNFFDGLTSWGFDDVAGIPTTLQDVIHIEILGGAVGFGTDTVDYCAVSGEDVYLPAPHLISAKLFSTSGNLQVLFHNMGLAVSGNAFDNAWTDTKLTYSDDTDETKARTSLFTIATATSDQGCGAHDTPMGAAFCQSNAFTTPLSVVKKIQFLDTGAAVIWEDDVTLDCTATGGHPVYIPLEV